MEKGSDFDKLNETYVVFITEHDVMGKGLPLYSIERYITETGEKFGDGSHILYVNGQYRGADDVGKLMHDFFCTNPADMNFPVLADRAKYFKQDEKGVAIMCKAMEDMRTQALKEAARAMLKLGKNSLEDIVAVFPFSMEEVKELQAELDAEAT